MEEGEKAQNEFNKEFGEGMATFTKCDVINEQEFEEAISFVVKQHGRLDILCNNAGVGYVPDFTRIIDINLSSVIRGTLIGLRYMDTSKGGHGGNIINIASILGLSYNRGDLVPESCVYHASKHGVVGFTKNVAKIAKQIGVRLNCICPSYVDTVLVREAMSHSPVLKSKLEALGLLSVDLVAKGFMELLKDENKCGEAMRITVKNGIDYHTFPEDPPL